MDFETLDRLRHGHPAWRLLRADHAPLIASFLHRTYIKPNIRSLPESELALKLEDHLFHLRRDLGEDTFPRDACAYLEDWASDRHGWLRKYYTEDSDEPVFDITPATERALDWLAGLTNRPFIGTQSRLLTLFELLRQLADGTDANPATRMAELERRRAEIDAEIERIRGGALSLIACAVPFSEAGRAVCDTLLEFPLPLKLRRPSPRELGDRFEGVRVWIEALETGSRSRRGMGYEILWDETRNRQLGRNRTPVGVRVPTRADALAMVGKTAEAARFDAVVEATLARFRTLRDWLARKPLTVLDHADDWERILDCLGWFRSHPRSGVYARQIDVVGVHTKFIETRKDLLAELLDIVLPAEAIEPSITGARGFEARYGLRGKPSLVRFRILDARHAIAGLTDLTVPVEHFARLPLSIARVFVVENEITGLAFPPMPDSMVVLGMGHAVSLIAAARWVADLDVHYWGDLDTHGFAMLECLRASLPRTRSLLMDRATLLAHRPLWTTEEAPYIATLDRLTPEEAKLYADLRYDRLGRSVRLEQERISFVWLRSVLDAL